MSVLPEANIYAESTAAQLLRPRVELLSQDGGLNYKELNRRIVAENRTEGIPVDHNPVYGGISKEVCAVERQESFTISDKLLSFDKYGYYVEPRKVAIRTTDDNPTIVTKADGFVGDQITIDVNKLVASLELKAVKANGEEVDGSVELDKTKLIIDESIINPFLFDFSDEDAISLTILPAKSNVIPLIFKPTDESLRPLFTSVSILVIDQRDEAVVPKVSDGACLKVASLTDSNSTSARYCAGKLTVSNAATFDGELLNSETNETLSSVTCEVSVGTAFPPNPTSYVMQGNDYSTKLSNTLFATATLKQSDMRDLVIVLPIIYESDDRPEAVSFSSFDVEQDSPLELTYENTGYTFRGDAAKIDSEALSDMELFSGLDDVKDSDNNDVTVTLGDVIVEKSLNLDQMSTKAHVTLSFDVMASPMKLDVEVKDSRPYRAKENWSVDDNKNDMAATIDSSAFNAGNNGQEWVGELDVTGSISEIHNQFGRVIKSEDFLIVSGKPINVSENTMIVEPMSLHVLPKEGGSDEAESVVYILLKDMTVIEIPVTVSITDSRS